MHGECWLQAGDDVRFSEGAALQSGLLHDSAARNARFTHLAISYRGPLPFPVSGLSCRVTSWLMRVILTTLVFHVILPKVTSGGQCHQANNFQIPVGGEQDLSGATVS